MSDTKPDYGMWPDAYTVVGTDDLYALRVFAQAFDAWREADREEHLGFVTTKDVAAVWQALLAAREKVTL